MEQTAIKKKIINSAYGYTLMELLVSVALIALISITVSVLLFTSLKGSSKAAGLAIVKQNGDHASGVLQRLLRDARSVVCADLAGNDELQITDINGTTTFLVEKDANDIDRLASSSGVYVTSEQLTVSDFDCTQISGVEGVPDIILVEFRLTLGEPSIDRPEEIATERFETRVSLRTY